jgi:hypothetical protein
LQTHRADVSGGAVPAGSRSSLKAPTLLGALGREGRLADLIKSSLS